MVEETVDALLEHIENPASATPRQVAIPTPLIVRGSARVPDTWPPKEG